MTIPPSRRDVLKATVALGAAASYGAGARRAAAQGAATSRAQIDGVLRQAVDAGEVPGVVAMAATDKGGAHALDQAPEGASTTP